MRKILYAVTSTRVASAIDLACLPVCITAEGDEQNSWQGQEHWGHHPYPRKGWPQGLPGCQERASLAPALCILGTVSLPPCMALYLTYSPLLLHNLLENIGLTITNGALQATIGLIISSAAQPSIVDERQLCAYIGRLDFIAV